MNLPEKLICCGAQSLGSAGCTSHERPEHGGGRRLGEGHHRLAPYFTFAHRYDVPYHHPHAVIRPRVSDARGCQADHTPSDHQQRSPRGRATRSWADAANNRQRSKAPLAWQTQLPATEGHPSRFRSGDHFDFADATQGATSRATRRSHRRHVVTM